MRRMSECRQLLTGTSMIRYLPPMGTAGFDRFSVSGKRRVPRPPPRMTPMTSCMCSFVSDELADLVLEKGPHDLHATGLATGHRFGEMKGLIRSNLRRQWWRVGIHHRFDHHRARRPQGLAH